MERRSRKRWERSARQRLAVAVDSGNVLERLMGPLPWKRVSFCHVRPSRKEMGVSLPGLVLVSDGFFGDAEKVVLSGTKLSDPAALGLLIIVDELSHQWNAYACPLPNELAEGISTFTNLLYIESLRGDLEAMDLRVPLRLDRSVWPTHIAREISKWMHAGIESTQVVLTDGATGETIPFDVILRGDILDGVDLPEVRVPLWARLEAAEICREPCESARRP